jgi:hypothetical protein
VVEVSKIVGSVNRHQEFDRGVELQPVRLYKLGDVYFVEDGNHRVSVARYQGVEWIDAYVTEFYPRLYADVSTATRC